jgi:hypothetical protein
MKCSYYIYYRTAADAATVRATVASMQAALAAATGIPGRLLRRADDATTWMEIYEDVADPARFERELAAAVERCGARALLPAGGDRHVERFIAA